MQTYKVLNFDEYIQGMKEYADSIKDMDRKEIRESLIRIGVLLPNGEPNPQICTDGNYGGSLKQ